MNKNIWINESYVGIDDDGKRFGMGDTDPYETFTSDRKRLFNKLQREHGPCKGSIYRDTEAGAVRVGWLFEKRVKYSDCDKAYNQETWVELVTPDKHPVKVTREFHMPINLDTGKMVA